MQGVPLFPDRPSVCPEIHPLAERLKYSFRRILPLAKFFATRGRCLQSTVSEILLIISLASLLEKGLTENFTRG